MIGGDRRSEGRAGHGVADWSEILRPFLSGGVELDERQLDEALAEAPLLWLLGKTGSGKSSVVRYLTGAEEAEVGGGYRPQTRTSKQFDFPDSDAPLVRFLDTRGLGEVAYDPSDDIRRFAGRAHLVVVTVRAADQSLKEIVEPLRTIRRAEPDRPVLLLLTCLHELTAGRDASAELSFSDGPRPLPEGDWPEVTQAVERQYERFDGLFDRAACVDLTPVEWGMAEPEFGGEALKDAVLSLLPEAQRHAVASAILQKSDAPDHGHLDAKILAYSCAAASAAAVPLPWVDIPVVAGLQWHLTKVVAEAHGQPFDRAAVARMSAMLGGRAALVMAVRELAKVVPYVGSVVNASAAFGITYAAGKASDFYFREAAKGREPTAAEVRRIYAGQIEKAAALWKRTGGGVPE